MRLSIARRFGQFACRASKSSFARGVVLAALGAAIGCQPATPPAPPAATRGGASGKADKDSATTQVAPKPAASQESAHKDAKGAGPKVDVATWAQLQEFIALQKGKVVVLDLWSNFCPPCIAELPQLVKIQSDLGKDVVCVSLNCNFSGDGSPNDEREAVLEVLTKIGANFQTFISAEKDTDLYERIKIASIPVIQVYDREGKLAKQFDNEKNEYGADGFTYEKHIRPFVESIAK